MFRGCTNNSYPQNTTLIVALDDAQCYKFGPARGRLVQLVLVPVGTRTSPKLVQHNRPLRMALDESAVVLTCSVPNKTIEAPVTLDDSFWSPILI